jgi:hypothetical protein
MGDFEKQLRCVTCDDIEDLTYAVIKPDGKTYMERREPPYQCEMCGGKMVVEDIEDLEDEEEFFDPEMN